MKQRRRGDTEPNCGRDMRRGATDARKSGIGSDSITEMWREHAVWPVWNAPEARAVCKGRDNLAARALFCPAAPEVETRSGI